MRVSTRSMAMLWLSNVNRQQVSLAELQQQIGSGKRIDTAGDDPAGAAQIVLLQGSLNRLESYQSNGETARRRLSLEENVLTSVTGSLDRLRELGIQAGGGAISPEDLQAMQREAQEILGGIVDLANSQDGEGRYLFSGNRLETQPFLTSANRVFYNGDQGVRQQRIGDSRTVQEGDSGYAVFQDIRAGNGTFTVEPGAGNTGTGIVGATTVTDAAAWPPDVYTFNFSSSTNYEVLDSGGTQVFAGIFAPGDTAFMPGIGFAIEGQPQAGDTFQVTPSGRQSLFNTVQRLVDTLGKPVDSEQDRVLMRNELNGSLTDLDEAMSHISNVRSTVGSRLAGIDQQLNSNEDFSFELQRTLSQVQDLDYATAISQLEQQSFALEAAQQSFARISGLSLFRVL